jgi:hypothetical protein
MHRSPGRYDSLPLPETVAHAAIGSPRSPKIVPTRTEVVDEDYEERMRAATGWGCNGTTGAWVMPIRSMALSKIFTRGAGAL